MSEYVDHWRLCSICKRPLAFSATYYACSVSSCNKKRTRYTFCSPSCWEAHLPVMRHRDAWYEKRTGPGRAEWERDKAAVVASVARASAGPRDVEPTPIVQTGDVPRDVLVVVSKLKNYIKARSGFKTSDGVMAPLSDRIRDLCEEAIKAASAAGRKTVLDRDLPPR